ncbi:MAG TPA: HAD hydrolase-like protein, partial [Rectinemataceae bacterium]|nr:HAD hydrolase-like protein [Rectinemataceae bacterium]
GNGFSTLMERALPPSISDDMSLLSGVSKEAALAYAAMALATTKPFPGIPELLSELRKRSIVLAVLSNKPDEMTKTMVRALFPDIPFLQVMGDKLGSPRKPDPANAVAIAALSGIPLREWAFVGDSGVDMKTGKASGMLPCGAAWGYRSVSELEDHGAEVILEKPADLLCFI